MPKEFKVYFGKRFYKDKKGYFVNQMPIHAQRWVWINHHGAIPDKMDIHHKDGDKGNNEIENLEMLSRSDHLKKHWEEEHFRDRRMKQLEKVRPLNWLKSEEGKKAVSAKGKEIWKNRKPKIVVCEHCGKEEEFKRWARFCCKSCYMKWVYKNKFNFVEAICPMCDKLFKKPKSKKTRFCSHSCAMKGNSK